MLVRHFRMINSEEVIGEIINESNDYYYVRNPFVVIELPDSITLSKYIPFSENQTVEFKKNHIIVASELHPEMIRYYYNTMILAKSASSTALEGLTNLNEQMEDIIFNSSNNKMKVTDEFNVESNRLIHSSNNTIH